MDEDAPQGASAAFWSGYYDELEDIRLVSWYQEELDEDVHRQLLDYAVPLLVATYHGRVAGSEATRKARVCDVGSGPGLQAMAAWKCLRHTLGPHFPLAVLGTDVSETALSHARALLKLADLPPSLDNVRESLSFAVDDITRSKLTSASFDVICDRATLGVISHEGIPGYVASVHRVLRPNGLLILKTYWVWTEEHVKQWFCCSTRDSPSCFEPLLIGRGDKRGSLTAVLRKI